jgi:ankyrin repeat protein
MAAESKFIFFRGAKDAPKGETPADALLKAVLASDIAALDALLKAKTDPNQPAGDGRLPLHSALRLKDERQLLDIMMALLAAGVNPNGIERCPGQKAQAAFQVALANNRSDKVLDMLLRAGADPVLEEDIGLPSLHLLALQGRYMVLETAHDCGIDIDRPDHQGRTCLMWAAREGFAKTVEVLLECGADPLKKNHAGFDVMQHAQAAPPESEAKEVMRLIARAIKESGVRTELKQLRSEVDVLRETVDKVLDDKPADKDAK